MAETAIKVTSESAEESSGTVLNVGKQTSTFCQPKPEENTLKTE